MTCNNQILDHYYSLNLRKFTALEKILIYPVDEPLDGAVSALTVFC